MIDPVGDDEQKLAEEHTLMDNHEDKVVEFVLCLQQLQPESKAALLTVHCTDQCVDLGKQFPCVKISLRTVSKAVEPLATGTGLDNCLLQ